MLPTIKEVAKKESKVREVEERRNQKLVFVSDGAKTPNGCYYLWRVVQTGWLRHQNREDAREGTDRQKKSRKKSAPTSPPTASRSLRHRRRKHPVGNLKKGKPSRAANPGSKRGSREGERGGEYAVPKSKSSRRRLRKLAARHAGEKRSMRSWDRRFCGTAYADLHRVPALEKSARSLLQHQGGAEPANEDAGGVPAAHRG